MFEKQSLSSITSPFAQLRQLLGALAPPDGLEPIDLTIGAPRHPFPDWAQEKLSDASHALGKYPPIHGSSELRSAITAWASKRYPSLVRHLDPDCHVLPLNGSREGLFYAVFMAKELKIEKLSAANRELTEPLVMVPNPFYQCYAAASLACGATPYYLPSRRETDFLPDLDSVTPEDWARTIAFYLCSPSNPEGAVADEDYLRRALDLAREHQFMLFVDECYSEIYTGDAPLGALQVAQTLTQDFSHILSFNSLSKRSNVPGLRSGFVMGDPDFLSRFKAFRNVASPQLPLPIQHVSAALWGDEEHVIANRHHYRQKFIAAEQILKPKINFETPAGGFFLWLNVSQFGTSSEIAKTLWKEYGVKVLPGRFLAQNQPDGSNPGEDYIRVALVDELETTEDALQRISMVSC